MADSNKESLFTFDPTDFVKGIKMMSQAMNQMSAQAEKNAKGLEGATNKGFGAMAKGQNEMVKQQKQVGKSFFKSLVVFEIFKQAVGAGFSFLKGVVGEFLPEVGQVFSVAKNIMFKNLFFPLRKFILPMLNRFLAWVTKSRGLFVKWGAVIVNVFKVVITVFKAFWSLAKAVIKGFTSTFGGMFKGMGKDLTEVVNLMLLKITTGVIALRIILKPVASFIGKLFGGIVKNVKAFGKAFIDSFLSIFDGAEGGMDLFADFGEIMDGLLEVLDLLTPAFEVLGTVLGGVFGTALSVAVNQFKTFVTLVKDMINLLKGDTSIGELLSNLGGGFKESGKRIVSGLKKTFQNTKDHFIDNPDKKVNDALITKTGKVIEFNPNDNILATQGGVGGGAGNMVTIHIPISVIGEQGDPFGTGQGIGEGVLSKLRDSLVGEIVLSGA